MARRSVKSFLQEKVGEFSPKLISRILYYHAFHKPLNLKHPSNLNEWIQWMKFYGDTSMWPILADKYKVRDYVVEKGLSYTLVKLYGVWDKPEDIEWDNLPRQFVLKMNNGCGDVLICEDKEKLNKQYVISYFNSMLNQKFGLATGQIHYQYIEPKIIAEELLEKTKQSIASSSLVDYKFWCINGNPLYCFVVANRTKGKADFSLYDMNWERHTEYLVETEEFHILDQKLPPPRQS